MTREVDAYLAKLKLWPDEANAVREVLLGCGLGEDLKWGKPCYSSDNKNICILQPMKSFLAVMFFKGALLKDEAGLLREQGPNSNAAKRFEFVSTLEIRKSKTAIQRAVKEAIQLEKDQVALPKRKPTTLPKELQDRLLKDAALRAAFAAMTPGRQRSHIIHISGAKQSETRQTRVEKCAPKIMAGLGFNER